MSDDFEQQEWLKFGVAAALSKQYRADQRNFLEYVATMLQAALPQEVNVRRTGGFFAKKKPVQQIIVTLGENRYTLEDTGHGSLEASRTRIVRGIALKTEAILVGEWVQELGAAVDERARTSAAAREALSKLVG